MEANDLRSTSASRNASHSNQTSKKQMGRKSTSATHSRDRSIDREEHPPIFAKKTSVSSPQSTAARKDTTTTQRRSQPVFRSKGMRPSASNSQSMGPSMTTTNNVRRSTVSNAISPTSHQDLHSTRAVQHPGSQGFNGKVSHSRHSLPLPSPSTGHRARTYVRKTTASNNLTSESTSIRRRSMITATAPEVFAVKSANALVPLWHVADDEYQARTRTNNRTVDGAPAGFDFIKRVTISSARPHDAFRSTSHHIRSSNRPTAFLGPNMKLTVAGLDDDTRMDEDIPQYQPRNNFTPMVQLGVKAARKREWPPRPLQDSDSDLSDNSVGNDPLESSESSGEDHQQGDRSESDAEEDDSDHDVVEFVQTSRRSFSPPEIEFLASPLQMVKTLAPTPPPQALQQVPNYAEPMAEPSEELTTAVEALTLSSVRMQRAKHLPFLLRNLRRGFISRCRSLNIPIQRTSEGPSVTVRYEYSFGVQEHAFETRMQHWVCPCCELHGAFQTREMLASHLDWDHDEVHSQWNEVDDGRGKWLLRLVIPEPRAEDKLLKQPPAPTTRIATEPSRSVHLPSSPFPYVTLSPPASQPRLATTTSAVASPVPPKLKFQVSSATPTRPRSSPLPSSTRGRSTTAMSATTSSTQKTPRPSRYLTPPPPSTPLGPAAQPPYLPAKSEYGGPDIVYSCRPGGPCLYDLLNTLPMEPFGVLAWDVLDREDEIYDSDNVKDEYKVMHALWARWIVLNRNIFIANYYKGAIAFVDAYWKMIHRAAGWDALRFWLLLLLSERFITANEVAKVLKHYEGLTGMEFWYD